MTSSWSLALRISLRMPVSSSLRPFVGFISVSASGKRLRNRRSCQEQCVHCLVFVKAQFLRKKHWKIFSTSLPRCSSVIWLFSAATVIHRVIHVLLVFQVYSIVNCKKGNWGLWIPSKDSYLNEMPPSSFTLSTQHAGRQAQHDAGGGGEVDRQPHP